MAATSLSSEDVDQVGKFFVTQYYNILYKHPEVMYNFYKDASTITLVDGNTVKRATGRMEIHLLISAVKISLIEVTTANFLRSYENGLMVVVSGLVQTGECEKRRKFIQAFFLAPQDNGYYILNDLVHFVDEEGIYIPDALAQGSYENLMMTQAVSGTVTQASTISAADDSSVTAPVDEPGGEPIRHTYASIIKTGVSQAELLPTCQFPVHRSSSENLEAQQTDWSCLSEEATPVLSAAEEYEDMASPGGNKPWGFIVFGTITYPFSPQIARAQVERMASLQGNQFVPFMVGELSIDSALKEVIFDIQGQYGSNFAEGNYVFWKNRGLECYHSVIFQQTPSPQPFPLTDSLYVHTPFVTTTVIHEEREIFVTLFPRFKETLESFMTRRGAEHVYVAVQMQFKTKNGLVFGRVSNLITFSDAFKLKLQEFFNGIAEIHAENHIHGNISGETMVLVEEEGNLKGKIIGSSIGTSGDPRADWHDVATYLEKLLPKKEHPFCYFDSEIQHLIDLLKSETVTDEQAKDHIALWSPERKRALIICVLDEMFANAVSLDETDILGTDEQGECIKWATQVDKNIRRKLIDGRNYDDQLISFFRFIRNLLVHGGDELPKIPDLDFRFDFDLKGIMALIDKFFPKVFVKMLKAAKMANISIPTAEIPPR